VPTQDRPELAAGEARAPALQRISEPFARLTGMAAGRSYGLSRWIYLRALGLIYLTAFVSLWVQVQGLLGPEGILPAQGLLDAVRAQSGAERYYLLPTVFWLGAGARALDLGAAAGTLAALLLVLDVWPRLSGFLAWLLYLSFVGVGQDFLAFQWDVLLLEAGLIAVLLAPRGARPRRGEQARVPALGIVLLWFLLFRLTFESGVVKLTSGDPTWRNLTALDYHYWTQPLPTWTAWYANLEPEGMKRLSVLLMFLLEIAVPPLVFFGRRARRVALAGIAGLQVLIFATGNYTFFNLLTIALALTLVDDGGWRRVLPARVADVLSSRFEATPARGGAGPVTTAAGLALLGLGVLTLVTAVVPGVRLPPLLTAPLRLVEPFRSTNGYGLFRVMTTRREEIVLEGSDDATTWRPYELKYKPGDVTRRPAFIEPHQPRLDWQMWFAALGSFETTPWFRNLLIRLLHGSPPVLRLFARNPFPDHPPRFVRALLYDYRFTTPEERRRTGAWWTRRLNGPYSPVASLRPGS
jgi:hypothetical protein